MLFKLIIFIDYLNIIVFKVAARNWQSFTVLSVGRFNV